MVDPLRRLRPYLPLARSNELRGSGSSGALAGKAFEGEMKQETTPESKEGNFKEMKKGLAYSYRHRLKVGS